MPMPTTRNTTLFELQRVIHCGSEGQNTGKQKTNRKHNKIGSSETRLSVFLDELFEANKLYYLLSDGTSPSVEYNLLWGLGHYFQTWKSNLKEDIASWPIKGIYFSLPGFWIANTSQRLSCLDQGQHSLNQTAGSDCSPYKDCLILLARMFRNVLETKSCFPKTALTAVSSRRQSKSSQLSCLC